MAENLNGICERCGIRPKMHWDLMWCERCRADPYNSDVLAKYDAAKRQEKNWDKEEIKELRTILAAVCMQNGELHIYDRDMNYLRKEDLKFEWKYESDNKRHVLRLLNE